MENSASYKEIRSKFFFVLAADWKLFFKPHPTFVVLCDEQTVLNRLTNIQTTQVCDKLQKVWMGFLLFRFQIANIAS